MIEAYSQFIGTLAQFPWSTFLFVVKIIALGIMAVALYWYISTLAKIRALEVPPPAPEAGEPDTLPREIVAQPWVEVQQKLASPNPADWSIAVIQADAILDKILKASGYIGDTMGDRLKQVNSSELNAIDDVWRAHKLRNRLAHGTEGALSRQEVEEAIRGYEKAFRELNYID